METTISEKEWLRSLTGKGTIRTNENKTIAGKSEKSVEEHPRKKESRKGFSDVAGMDELKKFVTDGFINVLNHKECAEAYGIRPPSLLFYGPSGCGKTFFAEKMAEEVNINFMKVVPDDLASTLIHGTQEKIGALFRQAERKAPTLLFFDEFDAMVPQRSTDDRNYQNGEVNEFLCMLNNASERDVYVVAATNHPERIDKAVLRAGRIDEMIYVDMPDAKVRESLFRMALRKLPINEDLDFERLALLTEGYNCSDISYIVKTASREMFNATLRTPGQVYQKISQELLETIVSRRIPSISGKELREYERVHREFSPKDAHSAYRPIGFR